MLDLFLAGEITLLVDDRILGEYRAVLPRPKFGFDTNDVADLLAEIDAESVRVMAPPFAVSLRDEKDLPFIEVAIAGEADSLVTGNVRHFKLPTVASLAVESPAQFVRRWRDRPRQR